MKVLPNREIMKTASEQERQTGAKPPNGEFGAILNRKIEDAAGPESPVARVSAKGPAAGVEFRPEAALDTKLLVGLVGNFLDKLQIYQQQLSDAGVSLKKMEPIVQQLTQDGRSLAAHLDKLPTGDGLRDILSQALVASSLEVIKFNRGDYL